MFWSLHPHKNVPAEGLERKTAEIISQENDIKNYKPFSNDLEQKVALKILSQICFWLRSIKNLSEKIKTTK